MSDTAAAVSEPGRFAFGENWLHFLDTIDDERIAAAQAALTSRVGDLAGKSFLDIGSGSGLSSLAARNLGATVVSFDYDPQSVACTNALRSRYRPQDPQWTVHQGSALDADFLSSLGRFDVVYSWGVLHHTGAMSTALSLAGPRVADDGLLLIAIYNDQGLPSRVWRQIKKAYIEAGPSGRKVIVAVVGGFLTARSHVASLLHGAPSTPRRGMDRRRDLIDWIGGWPFEVATPGWLTDFYERRGFTLEQSWTVGRRLGNNELLFRRTDNMVATR